MVIASLFCGRTAVGSSLVLAPLQLLLGLYNTCHAATDHITCQQPAVNVRYENRPLQCQDDGSQSQPITYNYYNWNKATAVEDTVQYMLFSAENAEASPASDYPKPTTTHDPTGAHVIFDDPSAWDERPADIGDLKHQGTGPWYVAGISRGLREESGKDKPGIKIVFSGWIDWNGNVQLCHIDLERPGVLTSCMC